MIQLDPAYPALSIDDFQVQFGVPAKLQLKVEHSWQERLLDQLESGVTDDLLPSLACVLEADETEVREFIAALTPVCKTPKERPPRVTISAGDNVPPSSVRTLQEALAEYGISSVTGLRPEEGSIMLLLSAWATAPHRYRNLTYNDWPHLIVEMNPEHFNIGPFVKPGSTPCGFCVAQHQRDSNPHWPKLQSQLVVRPAKAPPRALFYSAAAQISKTLFTNSSNGETVVTEVRLEHGAQAVNSFALHPDCYCQGFPEIETYSPGAMKSS